MHPHAFILAVLLIVLSPFLLSLLLADNNEEWDDDGE